MMRKILYPTDFSKASELGISAVQELRKVGVEEVFILHVVDLNRILGPVSGIDIPAVISDYESETKENLRLFSRLIEEAGFSVNVLDPRTGEPSVVISETADEIGADMIVIPSHGKGFISGLLLGSVSEGVVKRSKRPVLVIKLIPSEEGEPRRGFDSMFRRIIAGYDFSESSEKMMECVMHFADRGEAEKVVIAHILEKGDRIDESRLERLESLKNSFSDRGIDAEVVVEGGTPYKEMLRLAGEKGATLIAVSSRGEGFVRALLGGTADGIVRRSKIPVFVYKEQP